MYRLGLARTGGCLLGACLLGTSAGVSAVDIAFPPHPYVVNVTQAPYFARGDGVTDDTAALQRALNENVGRHRLLYFPPGTYLISATLTWPKITTPTATIGDLRTTSRKSRQDSIVKGS